MLKTVAGLHFFIKELGPAATKSFQSREKHWYNTPDMVCRFILAMMESDDSNFWK